MKSAQKLLIFLLLSGVGTCLHAQMPLTVWPGDANANGRVNNIDFLQLGLAYNYYGPQRATISADWTGVPATPWAFSFANGVNYAHADCNGDGLINFLYDAFPIYVHYGNTRQPVGADQYSAGVAGIDPKLTLGNGSLIELGANSVEIPLVLGSADLPIEDFYGVAFSIRFDSALVSHINQVSLDLQQASWVNNDNDRISAHFQVNSRQYDAALVRTDRNPRSGHGPIGTLGFVIIDDLIDFQGKFDIVIDSIKVVDPFGNLIDVASDTVSVIIGQEASSNSQEPTPHREVQVFPNPASDGIVLRTENRIRRVSISNPAGTTVLVQEIDDQQTVILPVNNLPSGIYSLQIVTTQGIDIQPVIIIH